MQKGDRWMDDCGLFQRQETTTTTTTTNNTTTTDSPGTTIEGLMGE